MGSPILIGSITTLIVILAVFLAYNANRGLPFVPTYRVSAVIDNGSRLIQNNEVRIGGHRVGVVESIEPTRVTPQQMGGSGNRGGANGAGAQAVSGSPSNDTCCVAAKVNLKLDKSVQPLPRDSILRVRYRSSFGLKYLEVTRGTGPPAPEGFVFNGLDDEGTCSLPVDPKTFASTEPASAKNGCFQRQTEFDAIADTFDTKTRTNLRANLVGFGDAVAGRGASLNEAIAKLRPLFANLKPVSQVLAEPRTKLRRFIVALGDTARIVAPVAVQQAQLFTNAAIAFDAISSDPDALRAAISGARPLFEHGTPELRRQRPFLSEVAELSGRLRPGVRQLRIAIPTLNDAITIGTPVLERTPRTNRDLRRVMVVLKRLVRQPSTKTSLQRLKTTFDTANPLVKWVAPAQTVCNYWNYDWTFLPEGLSDRDQVGFDFRQTIINVPMGEITIGTGSPPPADKLAVPGPAQTPLGGYSGIAANGRAGPIPNPLDEGMFEPHTLPVLNAQADAPTGQPNFGQYPDCQPGQSGYLLGRYPVPGQSRSSPAVVTPDLPGSRGITDVFFNSNQRRVLKNSTIPSHLPKPLPSR